VGIKTSVTITYLEMTKEPLLVSHPPANVGQLALISAPEMPVDFYRYLFDKVGRPYKWFSRVVMNDSELTEIIHDTAVELFVLYHQGSPAGFFEIDFRSTPDVEILFIGLNPDQTGRGLGRFLLTCALQRAWQGQGKAIKPNRVHLQTCTLDHPNALGFYQKMGFTPFSQEKTELYIPDDFF
jgi:GNAT superfamily N-acetyltransferase